MNMTVLNDRVIGEMIAKGSLICGNLDTKLITPNGYDIRADKIRIPGSDADQGGDIMPMTNFFISSMETINLPDNMTAGIWIRSSYARKGVIGSFGFIDAGFRGQLTLSFFNASPEKVRIVRGDRIAQVVFFQMLSPADHDYSDRSGNYQDSKGIKLS